MHYAAEQKCPNKPHAICYLFPWEKRPQGFPPTILIFIILNIEPHGINREENFKLESVPGTLNILYIPTLSFVASFKIGPSTR